MNPKMASCGCALVNPMTPLIRSKKIVLYLVLVNIHEVCSHLACGCFFGLVFC